MEDITLEERIETTERLAAAGFTPDEISEVLETPLGFMDNAILKKAYRRGFLTRQLELRERIFKDAKNGSSPAQMMAKKILDDCITKMGGELL